VKADIRQNDRNKGGIGGGGGEQNQLQQNNNKNSEVFTSTTSTTESPPAVDPFASPPVFSADGKTPRVKADINNQLIQSGAVVGGAVGSKLAAGAGSPPVRKQGSKKVELDRTQLNKIDFVEPGLFADGESATTTTTEPPFLGPDVKPDGRSPRVKANLLANKKQQPASNSNKVVEEEEEPDNRKKKLPVPPFIPTPRPGAAFSSRAKTTLNPFFIDQEESATGPPQQGEDLFVQSQPEHEDGEDEENIALFSSTFSPPTALPTFSTATGRGFDPFNLGPPPQPKIPTSVLSRLPPPANRRPPPVAIFTTPAPFTTAPPAVPLLEQQSPSPEGIRGDDEPTQPGSFGPNAISGGGRVKPASGQKTPRVKANELAKLNNQATRFRTSEPQKIFSEEGGRNQQQPGGNRVATPPERVRNQQVAAGATGRPAQNSIFSADDGPEEPTVNDGDDGGVNEVDGENAISTDEERDGQLFSATPLPLQEPPTTARPRQNFKFVRPSTAAADEAEANNNNNNKCSNPFKCPPRTFAGGRKPRVKSNIKALDRNFWHPEPRQSRVIKRRKQHVRISPVFKAEILGRRQGRRQQDRPGDGPLTNEIADNDDKELDRSLTNEISDNNELDNNGSQEEKEVSDVTSSTTPDPLASLQQLVREKEKEGRFFNSQQSLVTTSGKHKTDGVLNSNKPQQHQQQQSLGRPKPDFLNSQERLDPANNRAVEHQDERLPQPSSNKKQDFKHKQNAK
jgi:hypothetical protein